MRTQIRTSLVPAFALVASLFLSSSPAQAATWCSAGTYCYGGITSTVMTYGVDGLIVPSMSTLNGSIHVAEWVGLNGSGSEWVQAGFMQGSWHGNQKGHSTTISAYVENSGRCVPASAYGAAGYYGREFANPSNGAFYIWSANMPVWLSSSCPNVYTFNVAIGSLSNIVYVGYMTEPWGVAQVMTENDQGTSGSQPALGTSYFGCSTSTCNASTGLHLYNLNLSNKWNTWTSNARVTSTGPTYYNINTYYSFKTY